MDIGNYIMNLEDDSELILDELKPLIGADFAVKKERWEWQKRVMDTDRLCVTKIDVTVEIDGDGETLKMILVYCDFFLKGQFKFNGNLGLESIKGLIENLTR